MQPVSPRLAGLFLLITGVGAAHMGEQLIFGIEEFYVLKRTVGGWFDLFPAAMSGEASVLLITIVFLNISLMLYGLMRGGVFALLVVAQFGLLGVTEAHHWIEAILRRGYDPGLVTSVAYVWIGALILRKVWAEFSIARLQPIAAER